MRVRWGKSSDEAASDAPQAADGVAQGERCPNNLAQHSLAQALLSEGAVTEDALQKAYELRDEAGGFLGQILIDTSSISEDSLTAFLAKYCRIPHLSLLDYLLDDKIVGLLPQDLCTRFRILPIDKLGPNLTIAMVNPLDHAALDAVQAACPELKIKPVLCAHSHYVSVAKRLFGKDAAGVGSEDGNKATLEDFGFTPFDDDAADASDVMDGEAVVAEIMSGSDLDDDEDTDEAVATSGVDDMLAAMRVSMRDTYALLARRLDLFNGLSAEAVAKVFASGMTLEKEAGEAVFEIGDESNELYVVLRGSVEVRDGDRVLGHVPSGEILGATAWASDESRKVSAFAVENTSLITLSKEVFDDLLSKDNAVRLLMNIVVILSGRIGELRNL